jgi:hypothetical protein
MRVVLEVSLTGVPHCHDVVAGMIALGFRLGTASEATPYTPLEGAYNTPLLYAGGPISCNSTASIEADVFFVRS